MAAAESQAEALEFFIFGSPVTMSPSPDIHNTGFAENGCRHRYARFDSPDVEVVMEQVRKDTCGGGSVTIPHKEAVLGRMDELSDAAKVIGAVNTITKLADGKLRGDNTDWLGIKNQLEARLSSRQETALTCLLCGSGGTARAAAYAFKEMGAQRVLIYNRTIARAEGLAKEFGFEVCKDLAELAALSALHVVVDTLPGSAAFVLPDPSVLERCHPVVLEAAYIPRQTSFVKQALAAGCEVVEGVEMLFEQGCEQCRIWTGLPAPRSKIADALLKALFTEGSSHPAHVKMEPHDILPTSLLQAAQRTGKRGLEVDLDTVHQTKTSTKVAQA